MGSEAFINLCIDIYLIFPEEILSYSYEVGTSHDVLRSNDTNWNNFQPNFFFTFTVSWLILDSILVPLDIIIYMIFSSLILFCSKLLHVGISLFRYFCIKAHFSILQ